MLMKTLVNWLKDTYDNCSVVVVNDDDTQKVAVMQITCDGGYHAVCAFSCLQETIKFSFLTYHPQHTQLSEKVMSFNRQFKLSIEDPNLFDSIKKTIDNFVNAKKPCLSENTSESVLTH